MTNTEYIIKRISNMSRITHVKMCVDPDEICLEGGCLFCDGGTFKTVKWLKDYAWRTGNSKSFEYGRDHRWNNRKTREKES